VPPERVAYQLRIKPLPLTPQGLFFALFPALPGEPNCWRRCQIGQSPIIDIEPDWVWSEADFPTVCFALCVNSPDRPEAVRQMRGPSALTLLQLRNEAHQCGEGENAEGFRRWPGAIQDRSRLRTLPRGASPQGERHKARKGWQLERQHFILEPLCQYSCWISKVQRFPSDAVHRKAGQSTAGTWPSARAPPGTLCDSAHRPGGGNLCSAAAAHQAGPWQQNNRPGVGARHQEHRRAIGRDNRRRGGLEFDRPGAPRAPNPRGTHSAPADAAPPKNRKSAPPPRTTL